MRRREARAPRWPDTQSMPRSNNLESAHIEGGHSEEAQRGHDDGEPHEALAEAHHPTPRRWVPSNVAAVTNSVRR